MTKSTITREQLEEWVAQFDEDGGCDATDMQLEALIRQSLAAMDSESECLPLDYLQGHKDGLEWAAQLAEANHPETGDWLYDDPIELAKAIRKGTDMPPVQPVADREPDRNPVLAYADSYRDMAKQGVESVPIWSVITDLERNIAPLYRHAQPVPVVPYDFDFDRFNDVVWLECVASNPHMHSPTTSTIARVALELNKRIGAGNSPAQSDCCPAQNHVSPEQNGDTPAQSQGWIQVSERMPPSRHEVLVGRWWGEKPLWCCKWATYIPGHPDAQSSGWLIPGASWTPTHWMPLPAAPQEVKSE
ncbi:TPA: DUF551 domain-containing protein [Klebsiella pneumoniae]|nr:DUF551 domain-containing protein [Klebsiella pneumoniae]AYY35213.1 DUF551 domain-containing protein [Klebsiella pneumoniae]EKV4533699.1 DUF551 domain-containing protein [Klebsiella pneumoniae]EKZ5557343.1 DUF551 domain-containing protein [Klebsiella pneumoniae]EKZ5698992.1 DUF551 domain-containing protein [Klebsiella pneumoniae]EKZ6494021.1 DUF551 domain-containing protein [Klebsiella pneumoniae]